MSRGRAQDRSRGGGNRTPIIIVAVTVAVIVAVLGLLVVQEVTRERPGVFRADLGNVHLEQVGQEHEPYNSSPPTSGPHYPAIAPPDVYLQQIPDELQVHNLEDGFIVVQYDCPDGCDELVSQLTDLVTARLADESADPRLVMGPYSGIRDPETGEARRIALTAWTRIDTFDEFDAERIGTFIDTYLGIDHHVG